MILIVTHSRAFEADAVIDYLRGRDCAVFRFNTDCSISGDGLFINPSDPESALLRCDNREVRLRDLKVGWYQQPPPDTELNISTDGVARLRARTYSTAFEWLFCCKQLRWFNSPESVRLGSNKIRQLVAAKSAGLEIPGTIVTNQPALLRTFADSESDVIAKNLATPWYFSADTISAAYTKPLLPEMLADDAAVSYAPLVYQQRIARDLDVRVVVVDRELFVAATRPCSALSKEDIRRTPLSESHYFKHVLPESVASKLASLMAKMSLNYASVDFAVTDSGNWYFLDLNTTGAFLWVEKLSDLPITAGISSALMSRLMMSPA